MPLSWHMAGHSVHGAQGSLGEVDGVHKHHIIVVVVLILQLRLLQNGRTKTTSRSARVKQPRHFKQLPYQKFPAPGLANAWKWKRGSSRVKKSCVWAAGTVRSPTTAEQPHGLVRGPSSPHDAANSSLPPGTRAPTIHPREGWR